MCRVHTHESTRLSEFASLRLVAAVGWKTNLNNFVTVQECVEEADRVLDQGLFNSTL